MGDRGSREHRFLPGCTDDGTTGRELWKSDGTEEGTVLVKDIVAGSGSSLPYNWTATDVNGTAFFTACSSGDQVFGDCELWRSDGTEGGTALVKDIFPGGSSSPGSLTNVNGMLFFAANDGVGGRELWKSDGTEIGTVLVKDIRPGRTRGPRPSTSPTSTERSSSKSAPTRSSRAATAPATSLNSGGATARPRARSSSRAISYRAPGIPLPSSPM